ncbi:MAG: hypothetical protein ACR2IS_11860 [Nitrososphaeraceae archaeon]
MERKNCIGKNRLYAHSVEKKSNVIAGESVQKRSTANRPPLQAHAT